MPIKRVIESAREWLGMRKAVKAPPGQRASFIPTYDDLIIGILSVADGLWRFKYSDEFKRSETLRPIIEFPDINKTYESEELWQFFASRIPSTEQPEVEAILKREQIAEDDAITLLKRFGMRTINNPYQLRGA